MSDWLIDWLIDWFIHLFIQQNLVYLVLGIQIYTKPDMVPTLMSSGKADINSISEMSNFNDNKC